VHCQAAIAALHCRASRFKDTDCPSILGLYDRLERLQPSPIVSLNRAVAVAMVDGPQYLDALTRGWSPDNIRGAEAAAEEIVEIAQDTVRFIAQRADDREAKGGPVKMPDGSTVERLPGFNRWLWDSEFCGSIGFRWQPGTAQLPPHVLGHIGFSVVPWKRERKYATKALGLMLKETQAEGLPYVQLVTDSDNIASQKVILSNGGRLIEEFRKPAPYGAGPCCLRYHIVLSL
jgi:predicted acetyltransferase